MPIPYNWTCSSCKAPNVAGTDLCGVCGGNAIVSANEINGHSEIPSTEGGLEQRSTPLPPPQRFIVNSSALFVIAGVVLERLTFPPMTAWYIAIAMLVAGGLSMYLMLVLNKKRSNDT